MIIRKNRLIYDVAGMGIALYVTTKYNLRCEGFENIPKVGAALLVFNHQHMTDGIAEGVAIKLERKRRCNWVMKSGLPWGLNYLGGVRVIRKEDIESRCGDDKEKKKRIYHKANVYNKKVKNYIESLLENRELLLVHPEGTRTGGEVTPFKKTFIVFVKRFERTHGIKVPIIPVGIEYTKSGELWFRVGKDYDANTKDLVSILEDDVRRLSNTPKTPE